MAWQKALFVFSCNLDVTLVEISFLKDAGSRHMIVCVSFFYRHAYTFCSGIRSIFFANKNHVVRGGGILGGLRM